MGIENMGIENMGIKITIEQYLIKLIFPIQIKWR